MLEMTFEDIELEVREHLDGMLGPFGFDVRTDLIGMTVNRWGHGYSYGYHSVFDKDYSNGKQPNVIGRERFGNIAIANSDAGAVAGLEEAIKQGLRAVKELL